MTKGDSLSGRLGRRLQDDDEEKSKNRTEATQRSDNRDSEQGEVHSIPDWSDANGG